MSSMTQINTLIKEWRAGRSENLNRLLPLVYDDLHRIAHKQLRNMWGLETINTTVLVNEAYLKLVDQEQNDWRDRAHFLAVSAIAMRQILINYAEQKRAKKRGGDWQKVTFDDAVGLPLADFDTLLSLDDALKQLAELDERLAKLVELRFFGGLTETEIGCVLGVTERTVRREWRKAKAWLTVELNAQTE